MRDFESSNDRQVDAIRQLTREVSVLAWSVMIIGWLLLSCAATGLYLGFKDEPRSRGHQFID